MTRVFLAAPSPACWGGIRAFLGLDPAPWSPSELHSSPPPQQPPLQSLFSNILAKSHKGWGELIHTEMSLYDQWANIGKLVVWWGWGVGLLRGLSKHPVYTFLVKQHFSFLNIFFWLRHLAESWKDNDEIRFWHQYPNKLWEFRGKPNSSEENKENFLRERKCCLRWLWKEEHGLVSQKERGRKIS